MSEVIKRICHAVGKRNGSQIQKVFEIAFTLSKDFTRKGDFLWLNDMEVPKVRTRTGPQRKIELIWADIELPSVSPIQKERYIKALLLYADY